MQSGHQSICADAPEPLLLEYGDARTPCRGGGQNASAEGFRLLQGVNGELRADTAARMSSMDEMLT